MVKPQPSKLMTRVRSSLPAPITVGRIALRREREPSLIDRENAHIAQSVERVLGKDEVTGSNPVMSSKCRLKGVKSRRYFRNALVVRS